MWQAFAVDLHLAIVLAALAGLVIGSWLTVLTHRLPIMMEREWLQQAQEFRPPAVSEGRHDGGLATMSLWRPACHCPSCAAPVRGWRRLPLLGWLLLRGRCGACGAPIGWRYPVTELATAVLFALCVWRFGPSPLALAAMVLCAALLALAWIDLQTSLLPDALTLPLAWLGLLVNLNGALAPLSLAVLGAVVGYGFLWLLFHVFRLLTGREGMGYGDFKLLAALGAWFGVAALPGLLLMASLAGVAGAAVLRLTGRAQRGQPLPFGPYLALAGLAWLLAAGRPAWF